MPKVDFNNTTPPAGSGRKNVQWQKSGDQASASYDNLDPRLIDAEETLADILLNFCVYVEACSPGDCPPGQSCCPDANACITADCIISATKLNNCHWEISGQCGETGEAGPDCGPLDIQCEPGEGCDDLCRNNWCSLASLCDDGQCGSACYSNGFDNGCVPDCACSGAGGICCGDFSCCPTDCFNEGYDLGFEDGYGLGFEDGYDQGYLDGVIDTCNTSCTLC